MNGTNTNGVALPHDEAIADVLQDEVSLGYKPTMPLESLWTSGGGDMPQVTFRRDIWFMEMHPVVIAALEYYKSGIAGAEFWGGPDQNNPEDATKGKPISMDEKVSQFVLAHVERFWQRGVPVLQEGGYPYGWAPGEHIYNEVRGMLVWDHLKDFHPNDGYLLTMNNQRIGIRVKNVRDPIGASLKESKHGQVDLWFATDHIPAKAAWYSHRPRFNQPYGRSQLLGAWRPWRRLGWRDALEQIIDAACYRAGYKGPVVKFPPGRTAPTARTGIPATQTDGGGLNYRDNRDVARQIIEWAKAGAGFTISSEQYTSAQGGGPKWEVEFPDHVMDVRPLIEAARYLEDQIMLGMGVPPELVKAGGTGSGYSGRSIPREAFLDQQQRIADAMLQMFVEQVVRPLVLWNFGDVPFNVQCKPLLKSQAENKQGQPAAPLPQPAEEGAGGTGTPTGGGGGNPDSFNHSQTAKDAQGSGQAMSVEEPSGRVLEIVRRVLRRSA